MTVSTERISTLKRGRGGLAIDEKEMLIFSQVRKDADRKRLFANTFVHDCSHLLQCISKNLSSLKNFHKFQNVLVTLMDHSVDKESQLLGNSV